MVFRFLLILSVLFIGACSDGDDIHSDKPEGDHVWKGQTDTIERAREVEQTILDAAEQQRRIIEEQGG